VTFRRIMLVVLPLLGGIFVFMVLRLIYIDWESSLVREQTVPGKETLTVPAGHEEMMIRQGMRHRASTGVNLVRKDKTGRMEMQLMAERVEHLEKDTVDVDRPILQFFTKSSEIITLMADRARMVTKGALTRMDEVESGDLWGNTVMVHDRGTPDDKSDDVIISVDKVHFTNDAYELSTDGPVIVAAREMSLTARKMRISLDRQTRRINTMTFMEDILISLDVGDRPRIGLGTSPSGGLRSGETLSASPAGGKAAASKSAAPGSPPTDGGELWRIDLAGNVDARQEPQRLQCDHLVFYNQSAAQGKEKPAGAPAKGPPAAREAKEAAPSLVVMADGPLIITPVDAAERKVHAEELAEAVAIGDPVIVDDAETRVVGREVHYNNRTGSGSVIGKGTPILLEQPGRLRLTGDRLDFQRGTDSRGRGAVAEVRGEGQLHAQVQTASLTGSAKPKAASGAPAPQAVAPAPLSTLDAVWTRGMRLDFYRLSTDETSGTGEIRRAAFHGGAVVKQREGVLKGDDLTIDFVESVPGRGQAVERLQGHGDVFLKNEPPESEPPAREGARDSGKLAIGDITCEDLDVTFTQDASGSTQPKELRANGAKEAKVGAPPLVLINDPQGKIQAKDLTVRFGTNEKGAREAEFLEAIGDVNIQREDLDAQGDHVRRNLKDGSILLEGRPARAKRGRTRIVGPHVEFSQAEGRARVQGAGELEMPATSDLRGRPRASAEPMLVQWANAMLFEDKRNFAQFDGGVLASTGGSRLAAQRLWIYFADATEKPPASATPAPAGGAAATKDKTKGMPDTAGMGDLFGRKRLTRVLAEKDVRASEQRLNDDKTLGYEMDINGDNLTYLEENRKAYVRGSGRMRILAREKPKEGEAATPGLALSAVDEAWDGDVPAGYARTDVAWADSMAYDGAADRGYFKGKVEAVHIGRGAPGESRARRSSTGTRVRSNDLQVVFAEKKAPDAGARTAPATSEPGREERMTLDKLVADGNVQLWVNDRRGLAERLIYQRDPELIRLYRGSEDWARLWEEHEDTQEYGQVVARTITYEPSTGRIDVVDQQEITITPKPKPAAKPATKPRPAAE